MKRLLIVVVALAALTCAPNAFSQSYTIVLEPETATNPVGTSHTVTARVTEGNGPPAQTVVVDIGIAEGPNALSTERTDTIAFGCTDENGEVSMTYTSNGETGTDIIVAIVSGAAPGCTPGSPVTVTPTPTSQIRCANYREGIPCDEAEKVWAPLGAGPATQAVPAVERGIPHVLLCSPTLVMRGNGTIGHAFQVEFREWKKGASYIPAGSVPAKYAQGIGLTCDNLPTHASAGYPVDGTGLYYGPFVTPFIEGAVYPYWRLK